MAFNTSPNLWQGEYVQGVNSAAILGGDTIKAGLWRLVEGFEDKAIVKKFNYSSRLAAGNLCNATPGTASTMADLLIQLETFSISEQVCKYDFDNTNYAMYQNKGVFNKEIPREVLEAYIMDMAKTETTNLENIRWSGDVTSGNPVLAFQDGVIAQLVAAGTFIPATPASPTASQTAATVIAEINKVIAATPGNIRMQPNFKLIISPEVYVAYEAAISVSTGVTLATWGMGMGSALQNEPIFVGFFAGTKVPMYIATGLSIAYPEVILAGNFSNDRMGNLIFATDAMSDQAGIVVQDRQLVFANEPFVDITWSFRQGMAVARPEEVVLYVN